MGADGLTGEVYKILQAYIAPLKQELMNNINAGQPMPYTRKVGEITHMHKKQHARMRQLPTNFPNEAHI